jgi:2-amino-4-hydroxy-6-hydroxymethyldihydropteridine diphosphokinase
MNYPAAVEAASGIKPIVTRIVLMNIALISAGSNINAAETIGKTKAYLSRTFQNCTFSRNLITKPVGFADQPDFTNAVFRIETEKNRTDLNLVLKRVEKLLGRVRTANKFGPRTIDLDIVVWNGEVVDDDVYTRDFLKELIVEVLPEMKEKLRIP